MAVNPYVNKVEYGGNTIIDLTDATATADKILSGYTAYGATGEKLTGTASGGGVTTTALSVTANGTYTAPTGTAYTPVAVNVSGGGIPFDLPSDGKTRICYKIPDDAQTFGKTITLIVYLETTDTAISVDWGDSSEATTASGKGRQTLTHAYSTVGEHIVAITITAGTIYFGGGSSYAVYGKTTSSFRSYVQWAVLGTGVSQLASYAFNYATQLTEVRFPVSGFTQIKGNAFEYCMSLQKISIPNTVSSVNMSCFANCSALPKIELPNITSIPQSMFYENTSLTTISIPATVTTIGSQAFAGCRGLQKIRFNAASPATISDSNAFSSLSTTCIISVPTGYLSAYTSAANYPSSSSYTYIEE